MTVESLIPVLALIATIGAAYMASRSAKTTGEVGVVVSGWKDLTAEGREERQELRQDRDYWRQRALDAEKKLAARSK